MRVPSMMRSVFSARGGRKISGRLSAARIDVLRNAEARWGAVPITREQLAGWDQFFEPLTSEELALFEPR